jgi:hypothetical protein
MNLRILHIALSTTHGIATLLHINYNPAEKTSTTTIDANALH